MFKKSLRYFIEKNEESAEAIGLGAFLSPPLPKGGWHLRNK